MHPAAEGLEVAAVVAVFAAAVEEGAEAGLEAAEGLAAAHQTQELADIGVPEEGLVGVEPLHVLELEARRLVGQHHRGRPKHLVQRVEVQTPLP